MDNLMVPFLELFSLLFLGFYLARKGLFTPGFNKSLGTFLLRWSLPALILVSMDRPFSPEQLQKAGVLLGISLGTYTLGLLSAYLWGRWWKGPDDQKGLYQFALVFSNVGFMGFPIMEALWGRDILFWVAIYNIPFHFLVFTLGLKMVSFPRNSTVPQDPNHKKSWIESIKTLVNPGIFATLAGFIAFLTSWKWPGPIFQTLSLLGGLTTPLSMLLIGSLLAQSSLRVTLKTPSLWVVSFFRLLVLPIVIFAILFTFRVSLDFIRVAVVISAMPAAANLTLLAAEHSPKSEVAGQVVFISTLGSLFTLPVVVFGMEIIRKALS